MLYIDSQKKEATQLLGLSLTMFLYEYSRKPVFLCIGSDKIPGDALGPLTGSLLQEKKKEFPVFGTLEQPVHALNLSDVISDIYRYFPGNPIVAIDASLGIRDHIRYLSIGRGSLKPGAGVHKDLQAVGDIALTGIVAKAGPFAGLALKTASTAMICTMTEIITEGISAIS